MHDKLHTKLAQTNSKTYLASHYDSKISLRCLDTEFKIKMDHASTSEDQESEVQNKIRLIIVSLFLGSYVL